jgi:hypothetical protein
MKSQTKEEDLNVLLDKLKASTDSARERSMEVDHWKSELEVSELKDDACIYGKTNGWYRMPRKKQCRNRRK